jgi:2-C-methyl-D-erythritol 4-phosphate cytidylyltransferase / 2-C-methyl-D-erythritol 2,4-cyclodiphosphate synthase
MSGAVVLIVAAGRGHRAGGEIPKQYVTLSDRSVLHTTASAFVKHSEIDAVRVVIHPDDRKLYDNAVEGLELLEPVPGGTSRQESVRLGLESLSTLSPEVVLIHDGARPFVEGDLISRVLEQLLHSVGALPMLPVSDTLKQIDNTTVITTLDRASIWRAQTPQGFHYDEILAAHRQAEGHELTDDAAVAEMAGLEVIMVEGDEKNLKITTPNDLETSRQPRSVAEFRSGFGFDVHRFAAGDHVTLCGVEIAFNQALDGHSDADVGLHALTDAILGAIGCGDIGQHFPPTDPQWRGVSSDRFLLHAANLVRERSGEIINVDVTLICEAPKVGPHRDTMEARIADILKIEEARVNVKATTTERLGFTGRGEGIAAQAVAMIRIE